MSTSAPDNPNARHAIADKLARQGRFTEAKEQLLIAINERPDFGAAHYLLSTIKNYGPGDEHIGMLRKQLEKPDPDLRNYSRISFALAKALDQLGEYDEAFRYFEQGNEARQKDNPFDIKNEWDRVKKRISLFDFNLFERMSGFGFETEQPVFVVSMPRSGSTLVEHIIDSHPDASGAGESNLIPKLLGEQLTPFVEPGTDMPDIVRVPPDTWRQLGRSYIAQLAESGFGGSRTIDKQPFNYRLLGEIRLMLPHARIIWCKRDAMDTCLSCFTTAFRNAPAYCSGLENLGAAYRMHEALMDHWQSIMPNAIHTLVYEALVDDPQKQIRDLLEFLGLDWDPACLEFHRSKKQVTTASQVQVRQPLYQHSIGRWQRYEKWLQPLQAALQKY